MTIHLLHTYGEILKTQNQILDSSDFLRFQHIIRRKSLNISFSFQNNSNSHNITTDKELELNEIEILLNGSFPQIYHFGDVLIKLNGANYILKKPNLISDTK